MNVYHGRLNAQSVTLHVSWPSGTSVYMSVYVLGGFKLRLAVIALTCTISVIADPIKAFFDLLKLIILFGVC